MIQGVAAAVRRHAPGAALYVCGGGAHNAGLLGALARWVAPNRVATTVALGLDPDYVEAVAFAWFARRTLDGLTSSAGSVTGAEGARILGGVYRYARCLKLWVRQLTNRVRRSPFLNERH
jgi:anhydro-N-acetylmuramic acid kinase